MRRGALVVAFRLLPPRSPLPQKRRLPGFRAVREGASTRAKAPEPVVALLNVEHSSAARTRLGHTMASHQDCGSHFRVLARVTDSAQHLDIARVLSESGEPRIRLDVVPLEAVSRSASLATSTFTLRPGADPNGLLRAFLRDAAPPCWIVRPGPTCCGAGIRAEAPAIDGASPNFLQRPAVLAHDDPAITLVEHVLEGAVAALRAGDRRTADDADVGHKPLRADVASEAGFSTSFEHSRSRDHGRKYTTATDARSLH